jgi:hypothetical protein
MNVREEVVANLRRVDRCTASVRNNHSLLRIRLIGI